MESSWKEILKDEFKSEYFIKLESFLENERENKTVYPPQELIFNAFDQTPFHAIKVVIVGQDPYHGPGQAHGLSFSVPRGIKAPPSLKNIFKELEADLGLTPPSHGSLEAWARQGVLLLNASLTVREKEPGSHYGMGWEKFTDSVIEKISKRQDPIVFILWGKFAQEKCTHLLQGVNNQHLVLTAPHPSPYSAHSGFFGCKHFSKANEFLIKNGRAPINWNLS